MIRLYFVLIGLLLGLGLWAQEPTYKDVDYVGDGHPRHTLDIYIPPGTSAPAKTLVYIHGGWWMAGSKSRTMAYCNTLYESGYVIVGINYRLSSDSIFPAQIYDCKAAIRYIKRYSDIFHIDTCNIGVTGESAGGHLSALLGTSIGEPSLEGLHLGNTGFSSDVHAVLDFFGPTSFNKMDGNEPPSCTSAIRHDSDNSGESLLLGCRISSCPERVKIADPISYINGNEPPFSIHHGTADCLIPPNQSILLHNTLTMVGSDTKLILYEGGGHGDFIDDGVRKAMLNYFDSKLRNNCESVSAPSIEYPDGEISIYPNPGYGKYYFSKLPESTIVHVYSSDGRLLIEKTLVNNTMDISSLGPGTYLIFFPETGKSKVIVKL